MSAHQSPGRDSGDARRQMRAFRISERDLDSECRELCVEGELDLAVADQLKSRLEAAAAEDVEVLVRLDRCDFIDSTGIAAIAWAHQLMASKGRRLRVCNPSGQVGRVLALTGLSDLLLETAKTAEASPFQAPRS